MYSVTIFHSNRAHTAYFPHEWQAAQYAEMFLDRDPVIKSPSGKPIPLYGGDDDSEL